MKLTNPTDDQLNVAFAEHVAGWVRGGMFEQGDQSKPIGWHCRGPESQDPSAPLHERLRMWWMAEPPPFTRSADAVLPWLLKTFVVFSYHTDRPDGMFQFCADKTRDGPMCSGSGTFPRSACIALLKAHGVEIEYTKSNDAHNQDHFCNQGWKIVD